MDSFAFTESREIRIPVALPEYPYRSGTSTRNGGQARGQHASKSSERAGRQEREKIAGSITLSAAVPDPGFSSRVVGGSSNETRMGSRRSNHAPTHPTSNPSSPAKPAAAAVTGPSLLACESCQGTRHGRVGVVRGRADLVPCLSVHLTRPWRAVPIPSPSDAALLGGSRRFPPIPESDAPGKRRRRRAGPAGHRKSN